METKVCKKCGEEKPLTEFEKNKNNLDGYTGVCKGCINLRKKIKRDIQNIDKTKKIHIYSTEEKQQRSERMKNRWKDEGYRNNQIERSKELWEDENYRLKTISKMKTGKPSKLLGTKRSEETKQKMGNNRNDKTKIIINDVVYNSINSACRILNLSRDFIRTRLNSKNYLEYQYIDKIVDYDKNKLYVREYRKKNKVELAKKRKILSCNPIIRLKSNIHSLIYNKINKNGYTKKSKTYQILGCSFNDFKLHIENQFETWMNWDNYGNQNGISKDINQSWDLDHIIPISSATTEDDVIRLNHYTNFQPLCSYTNRNIKRDNINYQGIF